MRRDVFQAAGRDVAVSEALAQRLTKLRRDHPPVPARPADPELSPGFSYGRTLKLRVLGTLLEDAVASTQPGSGVAEVTVVLHRAGDAMPLVATRRFDATPTSHMVARSLARRLRAGATAHVHGTGYVLCTHPKRAQGARQMLRLTGVYDLSAEACADAATTRKDLE